MTCLIFTPALRGDRALKAWSYDIDSVILDLEDAVPAARKDAAREAAAALIDGLAKPWTVRINDLESAHWRDDLAAVLRPNLACVMLPKTQSADMIRTIDDILSRHEAQLAPAPPIRLLPIIESVRGLAAARAIATASPRVAALTFGEGDFSLDLGLDWDPFGTTLTVAKVQLVLDSRLAGIAPPHAGAFPHLHDPEGLAKSCDLARSLGFATKHCIHPEQVPLVRRAFAPGEAAVARARQIVARFEAALGQGIAAIDLDGLLVDYPVYHRAQQTVRAAQPR
jgi:citrate lyase subunit beta/citryl-CoA lyase